ncbi:MAG: polyphosphate kinase 1 [Gammaproteobacteria bacterium]|nr:polyphosphate kinase 1 [Gammaproteobacteria bacterium]
MDEANLKQPDLYINRDLSLVQFNRRVLEQARDESVPLLERLRFLCIFSSNLDELFETRVAGLKQWAALESPQTGPDGLGPQEVLRQIRGEVRALVEDQYRLLNDVLTPQLAAENIRFVRRTHWNARQKRWVKRYFENELLPVLSPLGLDPAHPFPNILNKSLNFIVPLTGKDAFGRAGEVALVQAPRALPRLIRMPEECAAGPHDFVFLSSIIHAHVKDLFSGMKVEGCYQFRVTRNSELFVDKEEIDDLLRAVEGELPSRRYGEAVRLEVADNCPPQMAAYLLDQFELSQDDLYQVNGPVNLARLMAIPDAVDRSDLKYPPFTPGLPKRLARSSDIFQTLRQGDVLLHHPYESFAPVVDFVRQAAADPHVLAIKQTLYRTGRDSVLVDALLEAARAGKEVTVVIELLARMDEETNINMANLLQEAGAHVVYGVVGYKTHAKMLLVVRREEDGLRHYVHLGTGNYHARTARQYTDLGLFTRNEAIGADVHKIFLQLTSLGRFTKLGKLLQAPFTLHKTMLRKIERETDHARRGRPARIIAKMNALIEPNIIRALYRASQAGVKIDLIVRGICCLRPGIKGVSENIIVRSIVGRFLEHSRIYYFHNNGDTEVFCASADWMDRNFFRRVETCFPIENKTLKKRVVQEALQTYLADNTQSWALQSDGNYQRLAPEDEKPFSAQTALLEKLAGEDVEEEGNGH